MQLKILNYAFTDFLIYYLIPNLAGYSKRIKICSLILLTPIRPRPYVVILYCSIFICLKLLFRLLYSINNFKLLQSYFFYNPILRRNFG